MSATMETRARPEGFYGSGLYANVLLMMQPFYHNFIFPVSNLGIAYLGWFVYVFAKSFLLPIFLILWLYYLLFFYLIT